MSSMWNFIKIRWRFCLEEILPEISEEHIEDLIEDNIEEEEEELIEEVDIQEDVMEAAEESVEVKPESFPPPETTKKVKVGGFFGKEITITTKKVQNKTVSEIPDVKEEVKESVSITTLKPPRKRSGKKIKLCQICGATIMNTQTCPICGAKTL